MEKRMQKLKSIRQHGHLKPYLSWIFFQLLSWLVLNLAKPEIFLPVAALQICQFKFGS